jgi:hypothetical protein
MKAVAELIPQVFFDVLARYVPGLVLVGSWILLLGQDEWRRLLCTIVGGNLDPGNALPTATLVLLFVPFVVGYAVAPLAKAVQRFNEHGWLLLTPRPSRSVYEKPSQSSGSAAANPHPPTTNSPQSKLAWQPKDFWVVSDKAAGKGYDWLRVNAPESGALAAKIRAEFTMHNALAVAFLITSGMAWSTGEYLWAVLAGAAFPLMAYRGATTEQTYQSTTRKLCEGKGKTDLAPAPRLIWLVPDDNGYTLWEDDKGNLLDQAETAVKREKRKAKMAASGALNARKSAAKAVAEAAEAVAEAAEAVAKAAEAKTKANTVMAEMARAEVVATRARASEAKASAAKARAENEKAKERVDVAEAERESVSNLSVKARRYSLDNWGTWGRNGRRLARELEHDCLEYDGGANFVFRPHRPSRWRLLLLFSVALTVAAAWARATARVLARIAGVGRASANADDPDSQRTFGP